MRNECGSGTSGVPMNVAVEVLKAKMSVIKILLKKADEMMQQQLPELKREAEQQIKQNLNDEIGRLQQLAKHNGQVRDDEINHLQNSLVLAQAAIGQTQPQLDSIRVLVTM